MKCDKGNDYCDGYNHRLSLSTCHKSIGHKSTCQSSLSGNSENNMININRNQHLDIVILGLGSIINSSLSRNQLCWCFLFIQSIKRIWPDILLRVTVFDPMIIDLKEEYEFYENTLHWKFSDYLSNQNNIHDTNANDIEITNSNERNDTNANDIENTNSNERNDTNANDNIKMDKTNTKTNSFKIFIMFHCPHALYDQVLKTNHLDKIIILGNDLKEYIIEKNDIVYNLSGKKISSRNINKSKGFESCTQACNEPHFKQTRFELDDFHSNVFTGSFWHSWNPVIVQLDGSNEIPQNLDEVDLSSLDFEKLQI